MNASVVLLDKVVAATVGIHSLVPDGHVSAAVGLGTERRGTGTLISSDGVILTVNYLLMGASSVIVTLTSGEQLQANVIAQDYPSGLGLLKIDGRNFPHLEVVSSQTLTLGEEIFTVASIGGEARRADSGLATYLGPFDALWEFALDRAIMTSAMNLGLGGGPVCNRRGEMIGISYLTMADIGRAVLAIPAECFLEGRDELLAHGRRTSAPARAWLGLLSYTLREHIVIAGLMPGGPGDKAGLKQGDVLISVDGLEIGERRALYDLLRSHQPGDRLQFRVLRNNQIQSIEIPASRAEDYYA